MATRKKIIFMLTVLIFTFPVSAKENSYETRNGYILKDKKGNTETSFKEKNVYFERGINYYKSGQYEKAKENLRKAKKAYKMRGNYRKVEEIMELTEKIINDELTELTNKVKKLKERVSVLEKKVNRLSK